MYKKVGTVFLSGLLGLSLLLFGAQILALIEEKPEVRNSYTFQQYLIILLSCFRARMSG